MDPTTATLAAASFSMGLSRGGLSGGLAMVGVLLAAQVLEPIDAAAFLLPILILTDPVSIWLFRKSVDVPSLKVLAPGLVVGLVAGYLTVSWVEPGAVRIMVGTLAVLLVADALLGHYVKSASRELPAPVGTGLGAVGGFTSFLIHSGMPPVAAYLLPKKLPTEAFLGTTAVFFSVANLAKVAPYHSLGLFNYDFLLLSFKMLPIAFVGIVVARIIQRRMSDKAFYLFIYVTVLLLGLRQFWLAFE